MSDPSAAQLLVEAENSRTLLRGNIARALPQSAVLPKQDVTPDELLRSIEALPGVKLTQSGGSLIGQTADGKTLNLVALIERALLANPALSDGRSVRHVQTGNVELFRDEMSNHQKIEFLKTHSPEEFGRLPRKRTTAAAFVPNEGMSAAQYRSLSLKEKASLAFTERQIGEILQRH